MRWRAARVIGRTGRSQAAQARARVASADKLGPDVRSPQRCPDERNMDAPQLRVVGGEFYPDWEAVYRDNVDRVYRLMFAKVGNRPDAEDLTAEVFLAALRPLRVSATVPEVRAYLLTTARTVLAGYWRRTLGREITRLTEDDDLEGVSTDAPVAPEAAKRTAAILADLPELYRRILELRFLESCSVREAAAALGVSVTYAKVLQHRALRRAAQRLEVNR
jgi:RNA polymerase sigma factor (sigma-70 family)